MEQGPPARAPFSISRVGDALPGPGRPLPARRLLPQQHPRQPGVLLAVRPLQRFPRLPRVTATPALAAHCPDKDRQPDPRPVRRPLSLQPTLSTARRAHSSATRARGVLGAPGGCCTRDEGPGSGPPGQRLGGGPVPALSHHLPTRPAAPRLPSGSPFLARIFPHALPWPPSTRRTAPAGVSGPPQAGRSPHAPPVAVIPAPAWVSRSGTGAYSRAGSSRATPARASPGITTLFYTSSREAPCAAPVDWYLSGGGCSHPISSSCNRARARRAPGAQGGRQSCSGPRGAGQTALPRPAWCSTQSQGEREPRLQPETSRLGSHSSCFCQLAQDKKVGAYPRLESLRLALLWGLT